MKRVLALAIAIVALTGTDAFASRARLMVFGTGDGGIGLMDGQSSGGSLYADDAYNMFYNPSYIVGGKDWATIEKYTGVGGTGTAGTLTSPAQGGFMMSMAGFHFGAYVNRQAITTYSVFKDLNGNGTAQAGETLSFDNAVNMKPIELFVGSDMGVKWGLSLGIANFKESKDVSDSAMKLGLGAQISGFEPWVNFLLSGKNQEATPAKDVKFTDMGFGVKYKMGDWTPYAAVRMIKASQESNFEGKVDTMGIGIGRSMKAGDAKVMYNLGYFNKADRAAGNTTVMIPLNIAGEADVNSWLALRAGLGYAIMHQVDGVSQPDAVAARVGASIKAGGGSLDWVIGNGGASADEATTVQTQTFGVGSGFMSAVSMTYSW